MDGAVARVGSGWVGTGTPWTYDADKYGRVVAARRAETDLMRAYAGGARCLMQVLIEALDDASAGPCGGCSVCTGELPSPGARPNPDRVLAARRHLRGRRHVLEPRKRWPSGGGRRGRIVGLAPGRAVAFADDPAWRDLIAEVGGQDAPPSDELRGALVDVLARWAHEWGERPVAVLPVPSRSRPRRVGGMAEHIAAVGPLIGGIPPWPPGSTPSTRTASSTGSSRPRRAREREGTVHRHLPLRPPAAPDEYACETGTGPDSPQ